MADRYQTFTRSGTGRFLVSRLRLPDPPVLRRHRPGDEVLDLPALLGSAPGGRLASTIRGVLGSAAVSVLDPPATGGTADATVGAVVFDATGIAAAGDLSELHAFFHPVIRSVAPGGRVIVLGTPPEATGGVAEAIAQRALEGFVRSLAKELRQGRAAHLVYVDPQADGGVESTLRFLLSPRSAYVSGQVIRIGAGRAPAPVDWDRPHAGSVALVTGAARGIGAATARVLARDGTHVVCLDLPAAGEELTRVAGAIGGTSVTLDLTSADATQRLVDQVCGRHGTLDVIVHNAGVTHDKTLARMTRQQWDQTLAVNLEVPARLTAALAEAGALGEGGSVVALSSIGGIGGNVGQTNYATSKAGVIGFVEAYAAALAPAGITVNAVAPGVIDTRMTAAMPWLVREASRRMNSMSQAGLPVDVAEAVSWLAAPASGGVTGQVVRVCGQHLMGA